MGVLLRIAETIDRLSAAVGRLCSWLALGMVTLGAFNAVARYLGRFVGTDLSSNAYIEAQWYMFSLLFLLGGAWTLQQDKHVRVDVLYSRLGPRGRGWIDLLGGLFFLLPFCAFGLVVSWPSVRNSLAVREVSPDPGGLLRYPLKAAILLAFALLALQGLSSVIGALQQVRDPEREGAG